MTDTDITIPNLRPRTDGWTPEIQHAFIDALSQRGSVRMAAHDVGRSRTSAYRLRARPDAHAFRAAWDASLHLAYDRLRELAMDRIQNGLEQRTYDPEGNLVARRIVHNDQLLMFLLNHLKPPSRACDAPDDALGAALVALDSAPAGSGVLPPVPRNGNFRPDLSDDELIEAVRNHRVNYVEAYHAVPGLQNRLLELWDCPIFLPETLEEEDSDDGS